MRRKPTAEVHRDACALTAARRTHGDSAMQAVSDAVRALVLLGVRLSDTAIGGWTGARRIGSRVWAALWHACTSVEKSCSGAVADALMAKGTTSRDLDERAGRLKAITWFLLGAAVLLGLALGWRVAVPALVAALPFAIGAKVLWRLAAVIEGRDRLL